MSEPGNRRKSSSDLGALTRATAWIGAYLSVCIPHSLPAHSISHNEYSQIQFFRAFWLKSTLLLSRFSTVCVMLRKAAAVVVTPPPFISVKRWKAEYFPERMSTVIERTGQLEYDTSTAAPRELLDFTEWEKKRHRQQVERENMKRCEEAGRRSEESETRSDICFSCALPLFRTSGVQH